MKKKIGIIGGAGPMSSCLLYKFIIQECQQKFGCKKDEDFPEIVLINYPFSDVVSVQDVLGSKATIESELQFCIDKLKEYGVDVFVIACNTLHVFLDRLDFKNLRFLNIVKNTVDYVKQQNLKKLLILGTKATNKSRIYDNLGIETIYLQDLDQQKISQIICKILSGNFTQKDSDLISKIIYQKSKKEFFDGVVLACTDFAVLQEQFPIRLTEKNILILDSLKILTEKIVSEVIS